MTNVFISYAREDVLIARKLTEELSRYGYNIFLDQQSIRLGSHWLEDMLKNLKNADVFIALVTEHSDKSYYFNIEVAGAISYVTNSNRSKLVLPVVLDKEALNNSDLGVFQALFARSNDMTNLVNKIVNAISRFEGARVAQEETKEIRAKVLKDESADYISETIEDLKAREKDGRQLSSRWHLAGYGALVASVIFVLTLWFLAERSFVQSPLDTTRLIFDAIKGVTVVALLLGLARYSFLMAKTHQLEALKNADRLHAISFGKFYMRVFSTQISQSELKEVFQHWNTSGASDLSHLDVDKIDSRFIELFGKISERFDIKNKS
ncbi:toll/interleukin-1 receptor domain-containing protein [Salmonella enterica subsp. enterica serovar Oranienburg]|nr:toll/interleukin-1 receptor domain-containing protein [Salmonella enterica subsp. enterica serovar Oranienburg]ECO4188002.1 toll/interleukin-1 receptor domain-containing protein [Salmonella enterica]EEL0253960.1 toll/interleukin-1 receptor domain-containing protein [Salmonella enterica]